MIVKTTVGLALDKMGPTLEHAISDRANRTLKRLHAIEWFMGRDMEIEIDAEIFRKMYMNQWID